MCNYSIFKRNGYDWYEYTSVYGVKIAKNHWMILQMTPVWLWNISSPGEHTYTRRFVYLPYTNVHSDSSSFVRDYFRPLFTPSQSPREAIEKEFYFFFFKFQTNYNRLSYLFQQNCNSHLWFYFIVLTATTTVVGMPCGVI